MVRDYGFTAQPPLVQLPHGIKADVVRAALASSFRGLPVEQRLSLTWDRGCELAEHQELTTELGLPVYFCDKRSPWQRGTNENTNRLLRQYLPENGDLRQFSQQEPNELADKINTRPRKVLDWGTSSDAFNPSARPLLQPYKRIPDRDAFRILPLATGHG